MARIFPSKIPRVKPLGSDIKKTFTTRWMRRTPMGKIGMEVVLRDWYFDRPAVQKAIRRARMDPVRLRRVALQVRMIAKRSIRKRRSKRASQAPNPPFSRAEGHPMRLIGAGFNPLAGYAIVGAEYLHRSYRTTVPSVHEHGKRVRIQTRPRHRRGHRRSSRRVTRSVRYPKRPFMVPAMEVSKNRYPKVWENSLR